MKKKKTKSIKIRLSENRRYKLDLLAYEQDKTITQILEECIDKLPDPKNLVIILDRCSDITV